MARLSPRLRGRALMQNVITLVEGVGAWAASHAKARNADLLVGHNANCRWTAVWQMCEHKQCASWVLAQGRLCEC